MGKRNKPPGLPKNHQSKRQRAEIEARAMLLDAEWDKATSMFVKHQRGEHGGMPTWWKTFYDINGNELPQSEVARREKEAERRYKQIRGRHGQHLVPNGWIRANGKSITRQFSGLIPVADSISTNAADALRYAEDARILGALNSITSKGNTNG